MCCIAITKHCSAFVLLACRVEKFYFIFYLTRVMQTVQQWINQHHLKVLGKFYCNLLLASYSHVAIPV